MRYYLTPVRMTIITKEKKKMNSIGEDLEKKEHLNTFIDGNINWCSRQERSK